MRHVEATKEIEKLFNFLKESDLFISEQTALNISRFLKDIGGSAKTTTIKTNSKVFLPFGNESKCPSCGGLLEKYNLSEEERRNLIDVLLRHVLATTRVFSKADPEEIKRKLKYLDENKNFDLVVDGANVNYLNNKRTPDTIETNSYLKDRNLYQVIKQFSKEGRKVLIIHKKEIKKINHFYKQICDLE